MTETETILRISIAGKWSASEFSTFVRTVEDLYNLYLSLEHRNNETWGYSTRFFGSSLLEFNEESHLRWTNGLLYPDILMIKRLHFASPGVADFGGFGAAIGHLKDLILKLTEFYLDYDLKKLQEEKLKEETQALRLQNTAKLIEIGQKVGYEKINPKLISTYLNKKELILTKLIKNRQIVSVETVSDMDYVGSEVYSTSDKLVFR